MNHHRKIERLHRTYHLDGVRWEVEVLQFDNGRLAFGDVFFWNDNVRLGPLRPRQESYDSLAELDQAVEKIAHDLRKSQSQS